MPLLSLSEVRYSPKTCLSLRYLVLLMTNPPLRITFNGVDVVFTPALIDLMLVPGRTLTQIGTTHGSLPVRVYDSPQKTSRSDFHKHPRKHSRAINHHLSSLGRTSAIAVSGIHYVTNTGWLNNNNKLGSNHRETWLRYLECLAWGTDENIDQLDCGNFLLGPLRFWLWPSVRQSQDVSRPFISPRNFSLVPTISEIIPSINRDWWNSRISVLKLLETKRKSKDRL